MFAVDAVQSNRGSAGLDGIMGDNGCCDGLKLGDGCLPLWAFILLWLLMLGCLAGLAYMMRKHNAELEQNKNNQKYEQFCADAEMMDLADDRVCTPPHPHPTVTTLCVRYRTTMRTCRVSSCRQRPRRLLQDS